MALLNIGFDTIILASRVVAVMSPESAPIRRQIQEAKSKRRLYNVSCGRRVKSAILLDTQDIFLSALAVSTIMERAKTALK